MKLDVHSTKINSLMELDKFVISLLKQDTIDTDNSTASMSRLYSQ